MKNNISKNNSALLRFLITHCRKFLLSTLTFTIIFPKLCFNMASKMLQYANAIKNINKLINNKKLRCSSNALELLKNSINPGKSFGMGILLLISPCKGEVINPIIKISITKARLLLQK